MANDVQREDAFPHATGVAEVSFPVFAGSWGSQRIVVRIRLLQGRLVPGPACLRNRDGRAHAITLYGTASFAGKQPPLDPLEMEMLLEGVTILDISPGQIIIQGEVG